jgi:hypothetical protein
MTLKTWNSYLSFWTHASAPTVEQIKSSFRLKKSTVFSTFAMILITVYSTTWNHNLTVFSSCTYWQPSILLVKSTASSANKKIYIFLVFSHQSWFPCSNVRGTQAGKRKLSFWEADNIQVYRGLRWSKIPNELEEADEIEAAHWRWIVEPKQQTMCRRSFLPSLPRSKWIQAQYPQNFVTALI